MFSSCIKIKMYIVDFGIFNEGEEANVILRLFNQLIELFRGKNISGTNYDSEYFHMW